MEVDGHGVGSWMLTGFGARLDTQSILGNGRSGKPQSGQETAHGACPIWSIHRSQQAQTPSTVAAPKNKKHRPLGGRHPRTMKGRNGAVRFCSRARLPCGADYHPLEVVGDGIRGLGNTLG